MKKKNILFRKKEWSLGMLLFLIGIMLGMGGFTLGLIITNVT